MEGKAERVGHPKVIHVSDPVCSRKCYSEDFCLKSTATAPAPGQSHIVHSASYEERRKRWSTSLESRGWKHTQRRGAASISGNPDSDFPQHNTAAVSHPWAKRQERDWRERW